jgi:hypothetical protein
MSVIDLAERDEADFRRVLESAEGARFIAALVDFCGTFTANPENRHWKEGMRNVGLMLYVRARDAPGGEARFMKARIERLGTFGRENEPVKEGVKEWTETKTPF